MNIAVGIVRTKAMAIMLGPSGVGLLGLYGSIADLIQSIAGMGVNSSGVRQIAVAVGSNENERIAKTAQVIRRTSFFLGLLGAVVLFAFSTQLSVLTFGNDQYANGVALLSAVVFFKLISVGQEALIQGMRRVSDIAKMGVLSAIFGTAISIPVVYFLREDGVVLSLILVAAMTLCTSWWYRRKVILPIPSMTASEVSREQSALLKLGFAFMFSGLMVAGGAYIVRLIVVRHAGVDAAGLYQSAWALGGLYVGFILQAMGTDFYPRLTAVAKNDSECNRLVNEQAHISLLLAGPGVIATLAFAPLVISLFYTAKFEGAGELLRWLCFGMTLRVVSWPMGFIIVAKGAQNLFIFSELAWTSVYLGLAWICVSYFNLNGAGIAFFGSYVFHVVMIYMIVRRLSGFRWSPATKNTSFLFLTLITVVFCSFYALPFYLATGVGVLATLLSGLHSINVILNLVPLDRIPRPVARLFSWLGLAELSNAQNENSAELRQGKIVVAKNPVLITTRLIWMLILVTVCYILLNRLYKF